MSYSGISLPSQENLPLALLTAGQKYIHIVRFELIRMYEIQHNLRALPYLDFRGRLRLTFQLARVTLNLPVVVDLAMREDDGNDSDEEAGEEDARHSHRTRTPPRARRESSTTSTRSNSGLGLDNGNGGRERPRVKLGKVKGRRKRGLIPPPVKVVIGLAIGALEMGERVL